VATAGDGLEAGSLRARVEDDAAGRSWLEATQDLGGFALALPHGVELAELLLDLTVPHLDVGPLVSMRPAEGSEAWALVERASAAMAAHLGRSTFGPEIPAVLRDRDDPFLASFAVYAYLGLHPTVTRWHGERGIDPAVSRRTLADLGRNMAHHRRRHGTGGLSVFSSWLAQHFTGRLYQLGRLQLGMARLGKRTAAEIRDAGHPAEAGEPSLAVHIPDYLGPFTPGLCDESFRLARSFFVEHFPEEPFRIATCHSWLLDRELPSRLSPSSNIVRFQDRFTITHRDVPAIDDQAVDFVFRAPLSDIDRLPRDTSVQRAVIDHIADGNHWYGGVGWTPL
jgi:hypothetical protein